VDYERGINVLFSPASGDVEVVRTPLGYGNLFEERIGAVLDRDLAQRIIPSAWVDFGVFDEIVLGQGGERSGVVWLIREIVGRQYAVLDFEEPIDDPVQIQSDFKSKPEPEQEESSMTEEEKKAIMEEEAAMADGPGF